MYHMLEILSKVTVHMFASKEGVCVCVCVWTSWCRNLGKSNKTSVFLEMTN